MFPHKDDLSPYHSVGRRQEMLTTGWTALKGCGEAGEFSLFKWQRKHSHCRANEPHFVFSHAKYPLCVCVCVPCVFWHTCMEAGGGHRVLFYYSLHWTWSQAACLEDPEALLLLPHSTHVVTPGCFLVFSLCVLESKHIYSCLQELLLTKPFLQPQH